MRPNPTVDRVTQILGNYTDPIPSELLEAFRFERCVLLAGAGVSKRCLTRTRLPLPNWPELLEDMLSWASECGKVAPEAEAELRALVARGEHLLVGEELIACLGESSAHDFLAEVFDPDGLVPSRLHELLVALPFRRIVTTNYDNLLERAFVNVHKRPIRCWCLDELLSLDHLPDDDKGIIKLHGDLDQPNSIVLGQRQYQKLLGTDKYHALLEEIFSQHSVLMIGYGLRDSDVLSALDKLAGTSQNSHPHFLMERRGHRTSIERKRLAEDRNVHLIEYVDYFEYHNHVDTFLFALNHAIGNTETLRRIRQPIRCRVHVHYPAHLEKDGLFVWNFLFREGAITLCEEAQREQNSAIESSIRDGFRAIDYVLFVVDEKSLNNDGPYTDLVKKALPVAESKGVQVAFLVVGVSRRPSFLSQGVSNPCFYVQPKFSEQDLLPVRSYIAQDIQVGPRQP